jgi:hypothetical protein
MFDTIQFPADWVIRFGLKANYIHFRVIKNGKEISVCCFNNEWTFFHDGMWNPCRVTSADELIFCLEREFNILNNKEGAPQQTKC